MAQVVNIGGQTMAKKTLGFIIAGIVVLVILFKAVVVIPAGHVGIKEFFGTVYADSLKAGIHVVNPLLTIHKMSIRTQQLTEDAVVPSREGLAVNLDLSALFSLDPAAAPEVYKTIGLNYVTVIVVPAMRSVVRGATAEYEAKALYTAEREVLTNKMYDQLKPMLDKRGIRLEKVLLRSVKLPGILATAIEKKLEAEQQAEQMKFVLQRESQEAERKRIEAKGISDYNFAIKQGTVREHSKASRHRGDEGTRQERQRQGRRDRVRQGRPSADPRQQLRH